MRKYQKIDEADEENVNGENSIPKQSGSALDKLKAAAAAPPPPPLTLKVLNKEQAHQIAGGLTLQSTILQLKLEIERVIEVPIAQQRLIYAGKSLKPDDKTLASFKVENNSTIHLFPLPPTTVSSVSSNANGESSWTGGNNTESLNGHILSLHAVFEPTIPYPIYFDPEVSTHSREVRLWSVILIFLSGMTLFNNLSYNLSSGKFGNGVLDSIVSVTESTASAIGLYVAQLGLNSVRSMDLPTIRKYLEWLQGLAVLCVCMRILWVWDVVVQVQQAVENAKSRTNGTGTGGADAGGNGGSSGSSYHFFSFIFCIPLLTQPIPFSCIYPSPCFDRQEAHHPRNLQAILVSSVTMSMLILPLSQTKWSLLLLFR